MGKKREPKVTRKLSDHFFVDEYGHIDFCFPVPLNGRDKPEGASAGNDLSREIEELPEPFRSQVKEEQTRRLAKAYAVLLDIARRHEKGGSEDIAKTEKERGRGQEI